METRKSTFGIVCGKEKSRHMKQLGSSNEAQL